MKNKLDYIAVVGIAVGLAMDAFAVSVTNGAVTKNVKIGLAFKISLCFGVFQGVMPVIGWVIGKAGEGLISQVDHWIAFILLAFLGGKMVFDYVKSSGECLKNDETITMKALLVMALATSIDALATGVILPSAVGADTLALMLISVLIIALITFSLCFLGVYIGKACGCIVSRYATLLGGIVLVLIGGKILIEHLLLV